MCLTIEYYYKLPLISGVHSEVRLNQASIEVNKDEQYEMVCKAVKVNGDIKACAWITPAGKTYILWADAT